jgi:indole-3-glycerol phosphate synthase
MILDEIVRFRRDDVARAIRDTPLKELEQSPTYATPRRGFAQALRRGGVAIIAEVKKASPSRGVIRPEFDPVAIARAYEHAGAIAVSVLTEERFFQGHLDHLGQVRRAVNLPILRKDFLIDPYQVIEARAWGADAVLFIVAILGDPQLDEMLAAAREQGVDALVEIHDERELERALTSGAEIIGINNRDLRTFVTTLETAERLRPLVPASAVPVAESGISSPADIVRLRRAGFDAFLIGECLMRAPDPGMKLRELLCQSWGGAADG